MNIKESKGLLIIILLAFFVRLIFGLFMLSKVNMQNLDWWNDDWCYIAYSRSIFNLDFIFNPENITQDYSDLPRDGSDVIAPGWPIIVAILLKLSHSYTSIIIFNAIIGSLLTYLVYKLAFMCTNNNKISLFAALWQALYILHIRISYRVLKEPFVSLLILLIVLVAISNFKRVNLKALLLAFLITYLIHTDERYLVAIPFIFLGLWFVYHKSSLKLVIISSILIILISVPWYIRNYNYYGRPVLITIRTNVITDKIFGYKTPYDPAIHYDIKLSKAEWDSLYNGQNISSIPLSMQEDIRESISMGLKPRNFNMIEKIYYNTAALWRIANFHPTLLYPRYVRFGPSSIKHNLITIFQFGLLIPFFLIGSYIGFRNKNSIIILSLMIIIANWFIHAVLTYAIERYRLPIDPLIIIVSFYGLNHLYLAYKEKKKLKDKKFTYEN